MRIQIDLTRYSDDNNEEWEDSFEIELPDDLTGAKMGEENGEEIGLRYAKQNPITR